MRFPRLYAAASLKPAVPVAMREHIDCFPRLYAAASLKRRPAPPLDRDIDVFRGFMPRPH